MNAKVIPTSKFNNLEMEITSHQKSNVAFSFTEIIFKIINNYKLLTAFKISSFRFRRIFRTFLKFKVKNILMHSIKNFFQIYSLKHLKHTTFLVQMAV